MALISVTRLRVRKVRYMPGFMLYTFRAKRQARRANGFIAGTLASEPLRMTFWTITAWQSEAAMHAYRIDGAHMQAMRKLLDWCDEASVAQWIADTAELPATNDAAARMKAEGRVSKVRHPTAAHAAGETVPGGYVPTAGSPFGPC